MTLSDVCTIIIIIYLSFKKKAIYQAKSEEPERGEPNIFDPVLF